MTPLSILLLVLLVVWAGLLFGGFIFGRPADANSRRMARWTRIGSSLVLVLAAWLFALITPASTYGPYALLIAVGMTLGFVGDLFLAHLIPVKAAFLSGAIAFSIGHVAYVAGGWGLAEMLRLDAVGTRLLVWGAWLLAGVLAWYLILFRGRRLAALDWGALAYLLLVASTAGVGWGLALRDARLLPLALGGALFFFSDVLVVARALAGRELRRINIDDLVWLTYGPGQCLIVYTTLVLLFIPGGGAI